MLPKRLGNALFLSTLSLRRATPIDVPQYQILDISIHALLAESDRSTWLDRRSCRDFYPRSPCGERRLLSGSSSCAKAISIHALLAESDTSPNATRSFLLRFLSTLSLRRATLRSFFKSSSLEFLSTLSLRRATRARQNYLKQGMISIHALLAESDRRGAFRVILII